MELKPDCGEIYLLIGIAYASSLKLCEHAPIPQMIFCLALDMFEKAKDMDTTLTKQAAKYIEIYSNYFPTKEELFGPPTERQKYKIGCWINEETIVRYSD